VIDSPESVIRLLTPFTETRTAVLPNKPEPPGDRFFLMTPGNNHHSTLILEKLLAPAITHIAARLATCICHSLLHHVTADDHALLFNPLDLSIESKKTPLTYSFGSLPFTTQGNVISHGILTGTSKRVKKLATASCGRGF